MLNLFATLFISGDRKRELDFLAKVIAVSIYTDYKVRAEEIEEMDHILSEEKEHLKSYEIDYVKKKVDSLLREYANHSWKFLNDKDFIFGEIIKGNRIKYAKYVIEIFKADKEVSPEEQVIIDRFAIILENIEFLERYYQSLLKREKERNGNVDS